MNEKKEIKLREVKIGLAGDVNITSAYKNITLLAGEGYELNYLKNNTYKMYPELATNIEEILQKGNIIYEVHQYIDKNRLSFKGVMGLEEVTEMQKGVRNAM